MIVLKAVILGIIQGLTEFLPVSSSGHLVLFQELMGFEVPGVTFEVFVHLGTLLAVVVVYFHDLVSLVRQFLVRAKEIGVGRIGVAEFWQDDDARLAVLLAVGSVPAAAIGYLLRDRVESLFDSLLYVGFFWVLTSVLLVLLQVLPETQRSRTDLGPVGALVIGLFQSAAIAPGLSRSGSTIVGGVLVGLKRDEAANFSFLLSAPVIAGAALVDVMGLPGLTASGFPLGALVAGACAAALSGYLAITWLLALIRTGRLWGFAVYTFVLGTALILLEA